MVLELDYAKLDLIKQSILPGKSLDELLTGATADDNATDLGDTITDGKDIEEETIKKEKADRLELEIDYTAKIDSRCPDIIRMYFGFNQDKPLPQKAIAEKLGVTNKTIKGLLEQAMEYLKDNLDPEILYG